MFDDISKPPAPLPEPQLNEIQPGLRLLSPLTRRRQPGPGVIIVVPDNAPSVQIEKGVPALALKWAEEGYTVAELQASSVSKQGESLFNAAISALEQCSECSSAEKVGVIVYDSSSWQAVSAAIPKVQRVVAAIIYTEGQSLDLTGSTVPVLQHVAGKQPTPPAAPSSDVKTYYYSNVTSAKFASPFTDEFHYNTESVSHTRNLTFLKPKVGGPFFDLETIWDEHCYYEFADRSVQHTMSTMVQEPYVNHVPTLTGGVGRSPLSQFYRDQFIFSNPPDAELEMISRTIGIDRVVDEFIFKCTHDREIPWMLPGLPPTNKYIETPFTAVVNIRGDRLYHEHIAWDQGSLLGQLGLLPEYLPFPYPHASGKKVEYRLPVGGPEVARKMRDRHALPSNHMFEFKARPIGENGVNGHAEENTNGVKTANRDQTNGITKAKFDGDTTNGHIGAGATNGVTSNGST